MLPYVAYAGKNLYSYSYILLLTIVTYYQKVIYIYMYACMCIYLCLYVCIYVYIYIINSVGHFLSNNTDTRDVLPFWHMQERPSVPCSTLCSDM